MHSLAINNNQIQMRANILQENPYQVKNRRFKRTYNQNQTNIQLSPTSNTKNISTVKSLSDLHIRQSSHERQDKHSRIQSHIIRESIGKSTDRLKHGSSLQKRLKRKKQQHNEEQLKQNQSLINLKKIIMQKQQRIEQLQKLLDLKEKQNKHLNQQLYKSHLLQKQKVILEHKMREQIGKIQIRHNEEQFKLKQVIKKLQIDVNFINRKWSLDYERLLKEKDLQIKVLRQKYTNVLRAKRLASKTSSILTTNPSFLSQPQTYRFDNQQLDFSSFQLSKDDGIQH